MILQPIEFHWPGQDDWFFNYYIYIYNNIYIRCAWDLLILFCNQMELWFFGGRKYTKINAILSLHITSLYEQHNTIDADLVSWPEQYLSGFYTKVSFFLPFHTVLFRRKSLSMTHTSELQSYASPIIRNSSTEICLFSQTIHFIKMHLYWYGFMDIYFILLVTMSYYFIWWFILFFCWYTKTQLTCILSLYPTTLQILNNSRKIFFVDLLAFSS